MSSRGGHGVLIFGSRSRGARVDLAKTDSPTIENSRRFLVRRYAYDARRMGIETSAGAASPDCLGRQLSRIGGELPTAHAWRIVSHRFHDGPILVSTGRRDKLMRLAVPIRT